MESKSDIEVFTHTEHKQPAVLPPMFEDADSEPAYTYVYKNMHAPITAMV